MTKPSPNEIPDFVPSGLADLLRARTEGEGPMGTVPRIHFSEDYPSEFVVLMTMLVQQAISKVSHKHFILLLQMIATVLTQSFKEMLENALNSSESPPRRSVGLISHLATALGIVEFVVDRLVETYSRAFGVRLTPEVSAEFLESLGITRAEYDAWLKRNDYRGSRP